MHFIGPPDFFTKHGPEMYSKRGQAWKSTRICLTMTPSDVISRERDVYHVIAVNNVLEDLSRRVTAAEVFMDL